jgi:ribosomal protein S18 acetylase RimI-like enzyme
MGAQRVSAVSENEEARALDTLVSAFAADPIIRWLYPEEAHYVGRFPELLRAFGGKAFDGQTALRLDDFSTVALWLSPGTEQDGDLIVSTLTGSASPEQHEDILAVIEQVGESHPTYPHWYLPWFGVDAPLQGRGLGSELMTHCLRIVDADHLPAYLENTNPRNTPFYERHGFEVTGEARAGAFPPLTFMLRAAR